MPGQPDYFPPAAPGHPGFPAPADAWQWWWNYAAATARAIADDPGAEVPTIDIYGPVLDPDEVALMAGEASYSRFYGGDGSYQTSDLFVFGRPALVFGALAATAAVNAHRRAKARAAAMPCWREKQPSQVIATSHRLLCHTARRGWLSFYHSAVTDFRPDLSAWTLTLEFGGQCSPLQLTGPPVPALSLWSAVAILGPRWESDPRLRQLHA